MKLLNNNQWGTKSRRISETVVIMNELIINYHRLIQQPLRISQNDDTTCYDKIILIYESYVKKSTILYLEYVTSKLKHLSTHNILLKLHFTNQNDVIMTSMILMYTAQDKNQEHLKKKLNF